MGPRNYLRLVAETGEIERTLSVIKISHDMKKKKNPITTETGIKNACDEEGGQARSVSKFTMMRLPLAPEWVDSKEGGRGERGGGRASRGGGKGKKRCQGNATKRTPRKENVESHMDMLCVSGSYRG